MARVEKMVSVFYLPPCAGSVQKQYFVNNQELTKRSLGFTFLHHMSEANASYLEWNGKCFITKLLHLKRLHFYEARLSAYEAFCGVAAKYEAPQMRYEAKPFQASCFFTLKSRQKKWRKECHPRCFLFYCLFYTLKHWLSSIHSRIFTKISKKLNLIKKALNGTFYLQNGTKRHLLLKRYLPGNLPFRIVRQHNNFQPRIFVSVPADNLT